MAEAFALPHVSLQDFTWIYTDPATIHNWIIPDGPGCYQGVALISVPFHAFTIAGSQIINADPIAKPKIFTALIVAWFRLRNRNSFA